MATNFVIDMRALNLSLYEMRLLNQCRLAWSQVPNGHYLPAFRYKKAAERLIERDFLTKAGDQLKTPLGGVDWPPVVVLTEANRDVMLTAAGGNFRDEAEELMFVGVEWSGGDGDEGVFLARMRNLDSMAVEWLADRALLELRMSTKRPREPRGATEAALAAMISIET